jgi:hypothetical protein
MSYPPELIERIRRIILEKDYRPDRYRKAAITIFKNRTLPRALTAVRGHA